MKMKNAIIVSIALCIVATSSTIGVFADDSQTNNIETSSSVTTETENQTSINPEIGSAIVAVQVIGSPNTIYQFVNGEEIKEIATNDEGIGVFQYTSDDKGTYQVYIVYENEADSLYLGDMIINEEFELSTSEDSCIFFEDGTIHIEDNIVAEENYEIEAIFPENNNGLTYIIIDADNIPTDGSYLSSGIVESMNTIDKNILFVNKQGNYIITYMNDEDEDNIKYGKFILFSVNEEGQFTSDDPAFVIKDDVAYIDLLYTTNSSSSKNDNSNTNNSSDSIDATTNLDSDTDSNTSNTTRTNNGTGTTTASGNNTPNPNTGRTEVALLLASLIAAGLVVSKKK